MPERRRLFIGVEYGNGAMKQVLHEMMRRGIKVIANAGGINPRGCAGALKARGRLPPAPTS